MDKLVSDTDRLIKQGILFSYLAWTVCSLQTFSKKVIASWPVFQPGQLEYLETLWKYRTKIGICTSTLHFCK